MTKQYIRTTHDKILKHIEIESLKRNTVIINTRIPFVHFIVILFLFSGWGAGGGGGGGRLFEVGSLKSSLGVGWWGWALIRGWALINFFYLQAGRLF